MNPSTIRQHSEYLPFLASKEQLLERGRTLRWRQEEIRKECEFSVLGPIPSSQPKSQSLLSTQKSYQLSQAVKPVVARAIDGFTAVPGSIPRALIAFL
ncbi:hypothetical protein VNO80_16026 [Phaseolus coccineus]|uniref:Uncharacterized protein n=1 Tax=Phaseolus coccineus TaxID=3886 RepID=A0AAN9QZR0_PHACN